MSLSTHMGAFRVDVPASTLADPTSPTRAEWEAAVATGEIRPSFTAGGIIPPGTEVLARFNHDHVLLRRQVETLGARTSTTSFPTSVGAIIRETRVGHRSFDEVRERLDAELAAKITSETEF